MRIDDPFGDVEPKAGTRPQQSWSLPVPLKHAGDVGGIHAGSGVADRDPDVAWARFQCDGQHALGWGEPQRVPEKIGQDLQNSTALDCQERREKENTSQFGQTEIIQNKLEEILKTVILPNTDFKIVQRWSGIMGLGNSKRPIVEPLSENVYCGVRLGGMGIAIGSLVGQELADLI